MKKITSLTIATLLSVGLVQSSHAASASSVSATNSSSMALMVSNQSEQLICVSFAHGSNEPIVLEPHNASTSLPVKKEHVVNVHTSTGMWTIELDRKLDSLTLYKFELVGQAEGDEPSINKLVVKQVPASDTKDMLLLVNPIGQIGMFVRGAKEPVVLPVAQPVVEQVSPVVQNSQLASVVSVNKASKRLTPDMKRALAKTQQEKELSEVRAMRKKQYEERLLAQSTNNSVSIAQAGTLICTAKEPIALPEEIIPAQRSVETQVDFYAEADIEARNEFAMQKAKLYARAITQEEQLVIMRHELAAQKTELDAQHKLVAEREAIMSAELDALDEFITEKEAQIPAVVETQNADTQTEVAIEAQNEFAIQNEKLYAQAAAQEEQLAIMRRELAAQKAELDAQHKLIAEREAKIAVMEKADAASQVILRAHKEQETIRLREQQENDARRVAEKTVEKTRRAAIELEARAAQSASVVQTVTQSVVEQVIPIQNPQEALYAAIMNDSGEQAKAAIQAGADVNAQSKGKSLFFWAINLSKFKSALVLLEHGAMVTDKTLGVKCLSGGLHAMKVLLYLMRNGADVSEIMGEDYVSSFISNRSGLDKDQHMELIHEFINHGCDVNIIWKTLMQNISLSWVEYRVEIIDLFIKNGANINYEVHGGRDSKLTPLVILMNIGDIEIVKTLLDKGADINQKVNPYGHKIHTPLSYALERGPSKIAEMLLERGASID